MYNLIQWYLNITPTNIIQDIYRDVVIIIICNSNTCVKRNTCVNEKYVQSLSLFIKSWAGEPLSETL